MVLTGHRTRQSLHKLHQFRVINGRETKQSGPPSSPKRLERRDSNTLKQISRRRFIAATVRVPSPGTAQPVPSGHPH